MIRLWSWALDNAPSGDLSALSDRALAFGAGWRHEAGLFVRALTEAGWLDPERTIHDWDEYAGKLIERRNEDKLRKRVARASGGPAPDVHGMSNGTAAGFRRTGPNRTGPDTTGPDSTSTTPQPPPRAEGERSGRGRRMRGGAADAEAESLLGPLTPEDAQLWRAALGHLPEMTQSNREHLSMLEPLGRAADGGLRLRAPPGQRLERFRPAVARALADAGDRAAKHVAIVEQ